MYESIRIQNFRGLKDLTIENLGRVNLLVGANNVGKTSVLEAIWLLGHPAEPERIIDLARRRRGEETGPLSPESVWFSLFGNLTPELPVTVTGKSRDEFEETLSIVYDPENSDVVWNGGGRRSGGEALHFLFDTTETNRATETRMTFDSDGEFAGPNRELEGRASGFLPAGGRLTATELAAKLTQADDMGYLFRAVDALTVTEPRVEGVSLGFNEAERRPFVRVRLRDVQRPVPIDLLGTGSQRLVDIVFSIIDSGQGTFLVDEIGEGFYYDALPDMWRTVLTTARTGDVQVFATTHSLECIEAAVAAFADNQDDFRMHRISRRDTGLHATTYDFEAAEASLEIRVEVR